MEGEGPFFGAALLLFQGGMMNAQDWNELVDFTECILGALFIAAGIVAICSFIYMIGVGL